jgi:hypothetical protein
MAVFLFWNLNNKPLQEMQKSKWDIREQSWLETST